MAPTTAWRAVLATDQGAYCPPITLEDVLRNLDEDPDNVNAVKAILNVSGVVSGDPLPYNGEADTPYTEAIRGSRSSRGS